MIETVSIHPYSIIYGPGYVPLVKGIRLLMRTYCAVSIYTYMLCFALLCRGKETDSVNNLLQSLSLSLTLSHSLSRGCFVLLRYRRTRIGIRSAAAGGVQGKGREGKGRERGSSGSEIQ